MTTRPATAAALALLLATARADAQEGRWSVELRGGADFPTEEVNGEDLGTGFGFDGAVRFALQPHLGVYAGWGWIRFSPDQSFGVEADVEETGYVLGLSFAHPFSGEEGGPGFWLRAGGTYDHIEIEDESGDIVADSGHGLGWEAGAGVTVPLGGSLSLTPGARFRALDRDVQLGALEIPVDLRYVAVELGLAWHF